MLIWMPRPCRRCRYCGLVKWEPLIAVPDSRTAHRQGLIDRREHEADLQALVQFPGDHIAGIPIQDRDQIEPARLQAHVGDIDAPDVIRVRRRDMPQQIRIDRVRRMLATRE
jgi:hypothetical protein